MIRPLLIVSLVTFVAFWAGYFAGGWRMYVILKGWERGISSGGRQT